MERGLPSCGPLGGGRCTAAPRIGAAARCPLMERFCSGCGAALPGGANYCATCGAAAAARVPAAPDGSLATCPGCGTTRGRPGAMCPYCSSKYPNDALTAAGMKVALGGAALYAFGALAKSDTISGFGVLVALIGAGMFARASAGKGPSAGVLLWLHVLAGMLVLPAGALVLYAHGGPLMALAALPLWIPVAHLLDALMQLAIRGIAALGHSPVARWVSDSLRSRSVPSTIAAYTSTTVDSTGGSPGRSDRPSLAREDGNQSVAGSRDHALRCPSSDISASPRHLGVSDPRPGAGDRGSRRGTRSPLDMETPVPRRTHPDPCASMRVLILRAQRDRVIAKRWSFAKRRYVHSNAISPRAARFGVIDAELHGLSPIIFVHPDCTDDVLAALKHWPFSLPRGSYTNNPFPSVHVSDVPLGKPASSRAARASSVSCRNSPPTPTPSQSAAWGGLPKTTREAQQPSRLARC